MSRIETALVGFAVGVICAALITWVSFGQTPGDVIAELCTLRLNDAPTAYDSVMVALDDRSCDRYLEAP